MGHKRLVFMAVLCAFGACLYNSIIQQTPEASQLRASILVRTTSPSLTRSSHARRSRLRRGTLLAFR